MIQIRNLWILLIFISVACNENSRKGTTTNGQNNSIKIDSFRISFISLGTGIDYAQKSVLDSLIKGNTNCKVAYKINTWGREGEMDYSFTGPNVACLQDFYMVVEKKINRNERVQFYKNQ